MGFMLIFYPFFPALLCKWYDKEQTCVVRTLYVTHQCGLIYCGRTRLFGDMLTWKPIIWRFYFGIFSSFVALYQA